MEDAWKALAELPWTGTWCVSVRAKVGSILHPPIREESWERIIHAYASSDLRVISEEGREVIYEE